jgi:UDP-N-acetylglucosamine:LPS N-acetylglucosamine transferase
MNKQNYLFFYLKTGGGHLAPARSLSNFLSKNYGEKVNPQLIDGFSKTPRIIKYLIEDGYRNLQAGAKWYYEFLYALHKIPVIAKTTDFIITTFCRKYIEEVIIKEEPSKIIILHFFLINPVYKILKKHNLKIPVYTVVTDPYTAHPLWFLEKDQNFIVFSRRLEDFIKAKIRFKSINVFPFILDEKFSNRLDDEHIVLLKQQYNFPRDKKMVLVLGGGDGILHGKKILQEILAANLNAVIVVVCGRNKKLFSTAKKLQSENCNNNLVVYGFVDFVYELLNMSDIVVTKCGASTMMEILMMNKVAIVNDYIWEQEKGNIEFLKNNEYGLYEPDIKKMIRTLAMLINDDEFYNKYKNNIQNAHLKNGLTVSAEFIAKGMDIQK